MRWPRWLQWRRAPGYTLLDPRPIAADAPFTFHISSPAALAAVAPGSLVKIMFEAVPPSTSWGAERMWVQVTHRDGDRLTGTLDNDPRDIPALTSGDTVQFRLWHIIDTSDPDPDAPDLNQWLPRCFVDKAVSEGVARAGYLYREAPEHDPEDTHPDSGWRIRADLAQITSEENEAMGAEYVSLGRVLNADASILALLGAEIGSAFDRLPDGTFARIHRA